MQSWVHTETRVPEILCNASVAFIHEGRSAPVLHPPTLGERSRLPHSAAAIDLSS
jgi:hypothetical protein